MAPLIRNAPLATGRLQLGHRQPVPAARSVPAHVDAAVPAAAPDADALRALEDRLRAELRSEMDKTIAQVRESARRQGFEHGERQGRAQAAASMDHERNERQKALEAVLESLRAGVGQALLALQAQAADIAFVAIGRIVGAQVATPAFVRAAVDALVHQAAGQRPLVVRLHPRDASLLRGPADTAMLPADGSVVLQEDPALACGGCVVDSPVGSIDASLETQLRLLRGLLQENGGTP